MKELNFFHQEKKGFWYFFLSMTMFATQWHCRHALLSFINIWMRLCLGECIDFLLFSCNDKIFVIATQTKEKHNDQQAHFILLNGCSSILSTIYCINTSCMCAYCIDQWAKIVKQTIGQMCTRQIHNSIVHVNARML